jgi:hypothetical protein
MHSSLFTYNITRPYPFAWFTPVVFIGGAIAIVLFSLLNFVSTGYYLSVEYSTNPNVTVSGRVWFNHWPSFLTSKVQPTCQPLDVQVNSKFFTNQTGLTYTLTAVWQHSNSSIQNVSPSLTYYNNPIQNCLINSIEVDLEAEDRLAAQFAWAEWGANLRAYATCGISGANGYVRFNLTAEYDYVPETVSFSSGLYSLISVDKDARASLWWGESLLSMYWAYLTRTMQNIRVNDTDSGSIAIRKGTLYFTPSNTTTRNNLNAGYFQPDKTVISDITNLDYFDVDYRFIKDESYGSFAIIFPGNNDFPTSLSNLNYHQTYPNIWIPADSVVKSFCSTILTDLGQVGSPSPNILTNSTTLQHFTSNFSMILDPNKENIANARPGPALQDYDTLKSRTGPLDITPSVIFSKYLCQIPIRKSAGSLFVSILVADLVFLQALWYVFTFLTQTLLLRKRVRGPEVNYCKGCLKSKGMESHGLIEFTTPGHDKVDINAAEESRQILIGKYSRISD